MKGKRFVEERINPLSHRAESDLMAMDVCHKHGYSKQ